ncbi:Clavaminate synthase-like protein [Zea mays]|uniref:Clavaminate synthase-like protein n=1 Tax=Zea mays TaxID=4577 RepID=A0A1D6MHU2_MAIZE|nr:Clavaminate synthase-like protein [Zea mays]
MAQNAAAGSIEGGAGVEEERSVCSGLDVRNKCAMADAQPVNYYVSKKIMSCTHSLY